MYQMPYTQHLQPMFGTATPQMKSETEGSLLQNEPSQGAFNHHPIPMGCYNYGYVPAYYSQPYSQYPPPPPFYYHGAYPSFPPMYPVHYPPPPYYPIDQPRYEFDKNHMAGHHCCGCSGNQSNNTEDRHVRIERKEPNVENTATNALVPDESISSLVRVPQGYKNTREQRNCTESELKQSDQNPCGSRIKDNVKTSGKTNQDQTEGERNQFPFPFFWFPYNASEEEKRCPKELDLSGAKGNNSIVDAKKNEGRAEIQSAPEEMKKKNNVTKLIPVKQGGENGVKKGKEIVKEKGDKEKKPSENVVQSKFPPVCLRVEPSGRKKSGGTVTSRSPSPKRNEIKSPQNEKNEVKSTQGERKEIDVVDRKTVVNNVDERVEGSKDVKENEGEKAAVNKPELTNILDKTEKGETNIVEKKEMETKPRKKLSEDEAAVKIQSAYRGYEVRRWALLKKLKQIGEIREEMAEVKGRVTALEASFDGSSSNKVVISEMITSLLLKLDRIQGLHPTVREIRKSVAKELVSLQEQLDSLGNKPSGISIADLETDPGRSEVGQENEVCEEVDMCRAVLPTCELNGGEEVKEEITPSDCVDLKVENISSAEIVSEHQDDVQNHEMMDTKFNVSEPEVGGLVSETMVPSCIAEASRQQPRVADVEFSDEKDNNGRISLEARGANFISPSTVVLDTSDAVIATDETQGYGCKDNSLPENLEGETKQEMGVEHDAIMENMQGLFDESDGYALAEGLDDEIKRETRTASDDSCMGGKDKLLEETRFSIKDDYPGKQEFCVQVQGYQEDESLETDSVSSTKPEEPCLEPPIAEHAVESPKPVEFDKEEATKPEEMEGCEKELDMRQFIDEQEASQPEDMKGNEREPYMGLSEENQGSLEKKRFVGMANVETDRPMENENTSLGKQDEFGSDKKLDNEKGSEVKLDVGLDMDKQDLLENKYVIEVNNVGNTNDLGQMENMSLDQGKQVETASDKKLEEENEKLREMVAKLVEAGKEQLTVISSLSGRVNDLEVKLQKKKKPKVRRIRTRSSCAKASEHSAKGTV